MQNRDDGRHDDEATGTGSEARHQPTDEAPVPRTASEDPGLDETTVEANDDPAAPPIPNVEPPRSDPA